MKIDAMPASGGISDAARRGVDGGMLDDFTARTHRDGRRGIMAASKAKRRWWYSGPDPASGGARAW